MKRLKDTERVRRLANFLLSFSLSASSSSARISRLTAVIARLINYSPLQYIVQIPYKFCFVRES